MEWCPFLTSQLKKGVRYQTLLIGLFLTSPRESNLSSRAYSAQKITNFTNFKLWQKNKDSIFVKKFSENEFLKDVKIYPQKNKLKG